MNLNCKHCKQNLDTSCFYPHKSTKSGFNCYCIPCDKLLAKEYREKNKEKISNIRKAKYQENREVILEKVKTYTKINNVKVKEYKKKHYQENKPEIIEKSRIYVKQKRKTDSLYKLKMNLRSRLAKVIKGTVTKNKSTIEYLGCTYEQLRIHIESQFNNGMTWENQGKWHIDHIIPLSTAKTEDDLYKLCHYSNLQPLWALDNLKKSNKILSQDKING